jgi:hypothetical protein
MSRCLWQRAQKCAPVGNRKIGKQFQTGSEDLNLSKSPDPSLRHRNLLLDDLATERLDANFVGAYVHSNGLTAGDPGQGFPHRRIEVDIGRSDCCRFAIQATSMYVKPGIDTAADRKGLEPQISRLAGDNWISGPQDRRDHPRRGVVPGSSNSGAA